MPGKILAASPHPFRNRDERHRQTKAPGKGDEEMVEAPYLMGIDFGTGGVRVGLFDRAGTPVVFRAETFPTQYPRPSWAEQDPGDWLLGLVTAVRGAVNDSGIAPRDIAGISVDATSSTVLAVDRHDRYMGLALLWMDVRAAVQARRIEATAHPALKYNGFGAVSAEWGLPKAMWLKENRPEVWAEAGYICDCADWVVQRLTGEWASSINIASAKFYYDRDTGGFPESLYQQVGLDDFLDKYPSAVIDLGVVVGGLRRDVAAEMGLDPDTPVAQGGVDAYLGARSGSVW